MATGNGGFQPGRDSRVPGFKAPHKALQFAGFGLQVGSGGRGLLHHGGVLLGDLIHLVDGGVDLIETGRLLLRGLGDLRDQGVDFGDLADDARQSLACVTDQLHAALDLGRAAGDQALDLLGGVGRPLSQGPDFLGDDGEAAPRIAGASRLDTSVEGQKIGLKGDLVDHADDVGDLLRALLDLAHGGHRLVHHVARLGGVDGGAGGRGGSLLGAVGAALDRRGDLVERGGGFLQARGLLLRAP